MLKFEESQHIYHWNDKRVPSVTQILKPLAPDFSKIDPAILEKARAEGVAVHKLVELACKDDLGQVPIWLEPHLVAWRKFVDETGFQVKSSEERVYHSMYGYAGTLDLCGSFVGTTKQIPAIIDLKRSFAAGAVTGLQLSAYKEAAADLVSFWKKAQRWALRLNADGTYNMKQFSDDDDFGVFMACLKLHRFREKHA